MATKHKRTRKEGPVTSAMRFSGKLVDGVAEGADRMIGRVVGFNPREKASDKLMQEHIRMPGFPQLVVTRAVAYSWLKKLGWFPDKTGYNSKDYAVFGKAAVSEELTPEKEVERLLGQVQKQERSNPPSGPARRTVEFDSSATAKAFVRVMEADRMIAITRGPEKKGKKWLVEYADLSKQTNPGSIFDYEEAIRAGGERHQHYKTMGIDPKSIDVADIRKQFDIWWNTEGGKDRAQPKDKAGNQTRYAKAFKYGRGSVRNPRFLTETQMQELFNLYHLARTALSGTGKDTNYDRMLWASNEFHKAHPEVSATAAYKDLSDARDTWSSFADKPKRRGRRNPSSDAAAMYESFHGRPSSSIDEFEEPEHYHANLAGLGAMIGLKIRTVTGYDMTVEFNGDVMLCSNEEGTQLYLVGGDQAIDLKKVKLDDVKKDSIVVGEAWLIGYHTEKDFDNFQPIDYIHGFGEEKDHPKLPKGADLWEDSQPPKSESFGLGMYPTVRYDCLNERIYLDGGTYKIDRPLIGTSPGIEG